MCLLNCITEEKKYKHFNYAERTMIERWYNRDKKSKAEIARLLNKSERTLRREIKNGLTTVRDSEWRDVLEYSADVSQDKYNYNKTSKGPQMILDSEKELVEHIENRIKKYKESPEVIISKLKGTKFEGKLCARTIRNAIKDGNVFENISLNDLTYKKEHKSKNEEKRVAKSTPPEKSIENRPKEANGRNIYGHWEGDLIIGKRKKGAVLFTLTERMTREEVIVKIKGKKAEYVSKALNKLERKYGSRFYSKFKTITFDNGSEFKNYEELEKSCLRKAKRTTIYYAHPYCSGERGTNENNNRMIRRWIPKGISIDEITNEFIQFVEDWLNNYPRAMFDYKSSNMVLSNI